MDYYSALKKIKILPFVTTWVALERMMLSEISQMGRAKYYDFTRMWNVEQKVANQQNKQKQTHGCRQWNAGY